MRKFAVIGLGRFGKKVAEYLVERGADVLAIDMDKDKVEAIKDTVRHAVIMNAMDMAALKSVGVDEMDAVIIGVGENFEASVLASAIAKKLGIKRVIAKALTDIQGEILALVGVQEVLYPEDSEAKRLAASLMEPNVIDHIRITGNQSLIKILTPPNFIDKSIIEIDLRKKYGVTILEVERKTKDGAEVTTLPPPDFTFKKADLIVVIGEKEKIEKFRKACT